MNHERLFEGGNGNLDVCSTRTSTQKKLNKKEH